MKTEKYDQKDRIKMKFTHLLIGFLILVFNQFSFGQISPPGLGEAKTAEWFALGIRQAFNSSETWQSMTYIGIGRKSQPDAYNPDKKPAIFVINQEFYYPITKNWQTSVAVSYRRQNEYEEEIPYEKAETKIQQEFRIYGRLSYAYKVGKINFTPTLRQEFRRFFTKNFDNSVEPLQIRSRFRLKISTHLDPNNQHKLTLSSEQLFATGKKQETKNWSDFQYKESRFMFYYGYSPTNIPASFNIGYMLNLIGKENAHSVHYIAFDITLKNPFGWLKFKHKNFDKNHFIH